jgi:hypothetical protein
VAVGGRARKTSPVASDSSNENVRVFTGN